MLFPPCAPDMKTAGPELPSEKWDVVHVWGPSLISSCQPVESYAGYYTGHHGFSFLPRVPWYLSTGLG